MAHTYNQDEEQHGSSFATRLFSTDRQNSYEDEEKEGKFTFQLKSKFTSFKNKLKSISFKEKLFTKKGLKILLLMLAVLFALAYVTTIVLMSLGVIKDVSELLLNLKVSEFDAKFASFTSKIVLGAIAFIVLFSAIFHMFVKSKPSVNSLHIKVSENSENILQIKQTITELNSAVQHFGSRIDQLESSTEHNKCDGKIQKCIETQRHIAVNSDQMFVQLNQTTNSLLKCLNEQDATMKSIDQSRDNFAQSISELYTSTQFLRENIKTIDERIKTLDQRTNAFVEQPRNESSPKCRIEIYNHTAELQPSSTLTSPKVDSAISENQKSLHKFK